MKLSSRLVALPLAAALASAGLVAATATPAAAALPQCTKGAWLTAPNGLTLYLPATSTNSTSCFLAEGSVSSAVKALQTALKTCHGQNIAIDSDFGPATKQALKNVQSAMHIGVDGVYGTETRNNIQFVISEPNTIGPCRWGGWPR
ncbi:peptidoglycan-binding domain-containing protein [Streptomyces sp. NPDC005708]|uniref:peptidoglycan-binding domain-containing protein n=1 Tax=unclassified Streptomyces TaxID=2593676 RepID=UPI0034042C22